MLDVPDDGGDILGLSLGLHAPGLMGQQKCPAGSRGAEGDAVSLGGCERRLQKAIKAGSVVHFVTAVEIAPKANALPA